MRILSETEKSKIQDTIWSIVQKKVVRAICAYGSQVAGYARNDSDYDVILVLSPFSQRIKYYYLKGETECSALVVDTRSFENDCLKSSLGEFVSGRLLNPYEAIIGNEYLFENECAYKQKVLLEELADVCAEYDHFAEEIEFPLKYFLFEKLRKRASIYPPVVYSYSRTYGPDLYEANVSEAMKAFNEAAKKLSSKGIISFDSQRGIVRLIPDKFKGGLAAKLRATAAHTARGVRQYAVHGYAGRVGIDIVGKEVISKLSRAKERSDLPDWIKNPKFCWTLPDTKLFSHSSNWIYDILDEFGMDRTSTNTMTNALGEIYTSTSFYTLSEESKDRTLSIAVKRYTDVKGMKWGLLSLWSLKNTDFTANALERMHREYKANAYLRKSGLFTADILAIFLNERIAVTKFIKGKDLSRIQSDYLSGKTNDLSPQKFFGATLAKVHQTGYCVGDSKPSNAILSDSKIFLVDLEQAHPNGNLAWDIAEFIYYSVRLTLKEEKAQSLVSSFVEGYLNAGGNPSIIEQTSSLRYRAPFQAFIAHNVLSGLRKYLASVA